MLSPVERKQFEALKKRKVSLERELEKVQKALVESEIRKKQADVKVIESEICKKQAEDKVIELQHVVDTKDQHLDELESKLSELSRHCVYGFFTADKKLFYAGQSTDFRKRLEYHFGLALGTYDYDKPKPVHTTIVKELKKGGIFVIKLFENLTALEANDLENFLIIELKRVKFGANEKAGNLTQRFINLTEEERESEIQQTFENAMAKIQNTPADCLITTEKAETFTIGCERRLCPCGNLAQGGVLKCGVCLFIKSIGKCKRCPFEGGLNNKGYCFSCYTNHRDAINNGDPIPDYDPSKSRRNANRTRYTERALSVVMRIDHNMGQRTAETAIRNILGNVVISSGTIRDWMKKIDAAKNDTSKLAKILNCDKLGYTGLTSEAVDSIIVYKHSKGIKAKEAAKSLTELFKSYQDKDKFTLSIVQAKYDDIETVKKSLKRATPDDDEEEESDDDDEEEPEIEPKKQKRNANYKRYTERALTVVMRIDNNMNKRTAETEICKILGEGTITSSTIEKWLKKIDAAKNDISKLAKFLNCDKSGYSGLTSEAVDSIIVYKHSKGFKVKEASKSLTELFKCNRDKDKFTLNVVRAKYNDIETVKKSLKRATPDDDEEESEIESKKQKLD